MVPDLFFYVPIGFSRDFTHSWQGALLVDVPSTVILFLLWHAVLRRPVVDFLPLWVRARIGISDWMPRRGGLLLFVGLLLASTLIGIATHLAWDQFTHNDWLVQQVPFLHAQLGPLPVYKWGQHGGSIIGAIVIVAYVVWWKRRTPAGSPLASPLTPVLRASGVLLVLAVGLASALTIWFGGMGVVSSNTTVPGILAGASPLDNRLVFSTVVIGLACAGLAAVLTCGVWWMLRRSASLKP